MAVIYAMYFIFVLFALSQSTFISRKYIAKLEFDDKKSNNELLKEFMSTSEIQCARRCQRECSFFGFNPQTRTCRAHMEAFTSNISDEVGWRYYSRDFIPIDCKDLQDNNYTNTGVYNIYPYGISFIPVRVYCDMDTMDGGWTAIQRRVSGSLSFDKDWTAYKNGFGAPEQDLWVGNDVIHQLTKENSFLYVSITLKDSTTLYEMYNHFSVSDEAGKYQLFLAGPATGNLGDSMIDTGNPNESLSGMYFSTPDRDNDRSNINCAARSEVRGGWWFKACHYACLNGPWSPAHWGYPWWPPLKSGSSIRRTVMMIKRH